MDLFFRTLVLLLESLLVITETSTPKLPFKCEDFHGHFPNVVDCKKYFSCHEREPPLGRPKDCPLGKEFDALSRKCVKAGSATCASDMAVNFTCPEPQGFFSHLTDCKKYYQCQDNVAFVGNCSDGELFDFQSIKCVVGWNAICKDKKDLSFKCTRANGVFPNVENCKLYYKCLNNVGYIVQCPRGQLFDALTEKCLGKEQSLCEGKPRFKCPISSGHFPNLLNCRKFFLCQNNVAYRYMCNIGLEYDVFAKTCVQAEKATCAKKMVSVFKCPEKYGFYLHEKDCRYFYQCQNRKAYMDKCPNDEVFDNNTKICSKSTFSNGDPYLSCVKIGYILCQSKMKLVVRCDP